MPKTIPATGEAMPKTEKLLAEFAEFTTAVAIVKLVWLATDSPHFSEEDDLTDIQNVLYKGLNKLQMIEKLFSAANDESIAVACAQAEGASR